MELKINRMNYDEAKQVAGWVYDEPFSMYSMDGSDSCINELLNNDYFSAYDQENNLIGYYCFGEAAQVPSGKQFGAYNYNNITDIGLGLEPNLCGQGLGRDFLKCGLDFAKSELSAKSFRLTVASFNKRAIFVYLKLGFQITNSFERISENDNTEFCIMILK